jgi:maleate isomerase
MSKDQLAWRAKFGVLAPSTNSIVEADFNKMNVPGVTPLFSRIHIYDQDLSSEAQMEKLRVQLDESIDHAVDLVCTAEVDYMVMGMSAETFWDGKDGNERFKARIKERSGGLDVATGAEGCERALKNFDVKTIGVVTPYQANGDAQVINFFEEIGFEVKKLIGLKRPTAVSIAHTTEDELRDAILELDRTEPDAIVQVGTNLSMVRLAAEAERWLHKPVIAINAATWWMALRDNGIEDKLYGFGRLFEEF